MNRPLPLLALLLLALLAGCEDTREASCRLAVKSLVAAPEDKARGELDKVLAFGAYALPDIEQEYHGATVPGRTRLIDALRRLRLPEAAPFLELMARRDSDPGLRREAAEVARRLRNASR